MPLVEFAYNNSFHASIGWLRMKPCMDRSANLHFVESTEEFCRLEKETIRIRSGRTRIPQGYTDNWDQKSNQDQEFESDLRKYTPDAAHVLEPESVELRENLTFQVMPVRIDDSSTKKLRGKEVQLVKVAWKRAGVEEHTWELESEMRKDYPKLFSGNRPRDWKLVYYDICSVKIDERVNFDERWSFEWFGMVWSVYGKKLWEL
ncbi:uncharacterized protein [Arachis hypogaea]|uniref:uncharacterized protein n=1 Tax=Arachis hypogaea TaxID=3818 RepID=UPI000DEC6350|nr:uncharacterized protein LOC112721427 [Arachis hypogaea]